MEFVAVSNGERGRFGEEGGIRAMALYGLQREAGADFVGTALDNLESGDVLSIHRELFGNGEQLHGWVGSKHEFEATTMKGGNVDGFGGSNDFQDQA